MEKVEEITKEVKRADFLNEFLWICAGVNRKVLRQCPTDYAKYAGIGGTILFTALMAMLSGGYAIYTVFDSTIVAICFGIFWGLLIFNLDRFIVNTMYSDGKHTISWGEFIAGLPRIIIAIFLGIVISTPLELKIFEDEINVQIKEDIKQRIREYEAADNAIIAQKQQRIDSLRIKIKEIEESPSSLYGVQMVTDNVLINDLIRERNDKKVEYDHEEQQIRMLTAQRRGLDTTDSITYVREYKRLSNEIHSHRIKSNAINAKIKELDSTLSLANKDYEKLVEKITKQKEIQISAYQAEIDTLDLEIADIKHKMKTDGYSEEIKEQYGGFQAKMKAFDEMKESDSSTYISSLFIMLLFIIIETAPTFFKMMIASGPYDDLLRSEMHKIRVMSDKRISDINDEINTAIKISTAKNKEKLEAELLANKDVLNRIATAQAELLQTAIDAWREEELKKIKENPSAYIKTSTKHEK